MRDRVFVQVKTMETVLYVIDIALAVLGVVGFFLGVWWLITAFRVHWTWCLYFIIGPAGIIIAGALAEISGIKYAFLAAVLAIICMPFVFLKKHWDKARKPFLFLVAHFVLTVGLVFGWCVAFYKAEVARIESEGGAEEFGSFGDFIAKTLAQAREDAIKRRSGDNVASNPEGAEESSAEPSAVEASKSSKLATSNPQSRLGKIMATAEKNLAIAEERSAEGSEIVETTAGAGVVKAGAPAQEKADAPKQAPPVEEKGEAAIKATPVAAKKTSAPAKEKGSAGKAGYAAAPSNFRVISILDGAKRKTAMINDGVRNQMVVKGDKITVAIAGGSKRAEVVEILADAVIIRLDGRAAPMAINAPEE